MNSLFNSNEDDMAYLPADARYASMTYNRCGRSGLKLPGISLGLWHNFGGVDQFENGRAMLRRAFDLGITHFDLANNYGPPPGSAETTFGEIMRQDLAPYRDELLISSKAGYQMWPGPYGEWGSRKYMIASLDQSLRRMGLEYVDIFYSHRPDPDTPLEETMGALDQIVRSGTALREEGIGSIVFSPLAQGMLTDRYLAGIPEDSRAAKGGFLKPTQITEDKLAKVRRLNDLAKARGQTLAQMSLAWVLRHPEVTSALIGASRIAQIDDAVGALQNLAFTADELASIEQILAG
jgi:L-glyceraldehyde 3-phosphate reductase